MLDLHVHSTSSDGTLTPRELVRLACESGLKGIALTDHDTLAGLPEFMAAGEEFGMATIPGVEISADFQPGTMHILGYHLDSRNRALEENLAWYREGRHSRNRDILLNLSGCGVRIPMEEVERRAGPDGVVGRPHIAQVMIDMGYVHNKQEAFGRYLARGKPGYADRPRLSPECSIKLIRDAGGVPVLAHPSSLDLPAAELRKLIARLTGYGLMGIEVYYPEHSAYFERQLKRYTTDYGLMSTGGTDFHSSDPHPDQPRRTLGIPKLPDSTLEVLLEKHRAAAAAS